MELDIKQELSEYFEPYDNTGWKIVVDGQVSVIESTGTLNYASESAVKTHIKKILDRMANELFTEWRNNHSRIQEILRRQTEIQHLQIQRKEEILKEKPYARVDSHKSAEGILRVHGTDDDRQLTTETAELWSEMVDLEDKAKRKFRNDMKKWNTEHKYITYVYS